MAALALSLEMLNRVDTSSKVVTKEFRRISQMHAAARHLLACITLGPALRKQIRLQREFIDDLRLDNLTEYPDQELHNMGERVINVHLRNDEILQQARELPPFWKDLLKQIAAQQNDLESVGEALMLSSDTTFRGKIDSLIAEPQGTTVKQEWRDFVGSLPD